MLGTAGVKHVAIDARLIRSSGIGRFLRQVLAGLLTDDRFRLTLLGDPEALAPYASNGRHSIVLCKAPIYSVREQIVMPPRIPRCDLLYVPHYVVPLLYRGPLVVAVNDLIHLERSEFAPSLFAQWWARTMIRTAVSRAQRVVTLSEYSRDRLVQMIGAHPERIEVVYPSVDRRFFRAQAPSRLAMIRDQYRLPGPYLLFVGNAKPHKNLSTLIRAVEIARQGGLDHLLVIVGQFSGIRSNINALVHLASELGIGERVRFLGQIPDEDLVAVYAAAELFLFPSLAEGFGLTPLEAMACGTPVLAARTTAVPEACGEAAEYYSAPENPEVLAQSILALARDPHRRTQLAALGRGRARMFSGETSTRQMLELLYRA